MSQIVSQGMRRRTSQKTGKARRAKMRSALFGTVGLILVPTLAWSAPPVPRGEPPKVSEFALEKQRLIQEIKKVQEAYARGECNQACKEAALAKLRSRIEKLKHASKVGPEPAAQTEREPAGKL